MYFLIEDEYLLKILGIFGIKSATVWRKNLIVNPPKTKNF